jgi:hypothetical protein
MLAFTTAATTASGSSHEESEAAKMEAANLLVSLSGSRSSTPSVGGGGTAGGGAAIAFSPPSGYSLLQSPAASSGGGTVSSPRSLPGSRHNLFMPIVNPGNTAAGMLDLRWRSPVSGGGPALSSTASPVPPRFVAKLSHHQQGVIRPELVRPAGAAVTTTAGGTSGGNNNNQLQFLPTTTTPAEQLSLNTATTQQLQLQQLQQQHELRGDENAKIFVSIMQPVAGMMTPTSSLSARGSPGGGLRHPHHQQMVSISPLGAAAPPPAATIPITTFFSSAGGGGLTTSGNVMMSSSAGHAQQTITVIPVSNAAAMMPLRGQPPLNLSGDMMVSIGLKRILNALSYLKNTIFGTPSNFFVGNLKKYVFCKSNERLKWGNTFFIRKILPFWKRSTVLFKIVMKTFVLIRQQFSLVKKLDFLQKP